MRPSIWEACHHAPRATYPRAGRATRNALLFGLAPGGVYLADVSPRLRCALTAPFHPYPPAPRKLFPGDMIIRVPGPTFPRRRAGGFFSVALACGFPRLVVSQHPALWCPDFPPRHNISGGHDHSCPPSICASALNGSPNLMAKRPLGLHYYCTSRGGRC